MAGPVYFREHIPAIMSYALPDAEVGRLVWKVVSHVREYGIAYVSAGHVRSGRLVRSIYANQPKMDGPYKLMAHAGANAKHADYFIKGTGPIITHSPYMLVPKYGDFGGTPSAAIKGRGSMLYAEWKAGGKKEKRGFNRKTEIRGQRPHPFLDEGLTAALARYVL